MSVLMPTEIKLDKLIYHTPVKEKGYHKSLITYSNESVILQTPPLELKSLDNGIELNIQKNKKQERLYTIIRSLELNATKVMTNNSKEWFGQEIPHSKIKTMFRSCLLNPETINGSFSIRFRKDRHIQIYNDKKQITTEDDLNCSTNNSKGISDNLLCLLKINGILFGKNTAKLDIRIVQIKVCPPVPKLPQGCNVSNDSDCESESDYDSDMDDFDFVNNENVRNVAITLPTKLAPALAHIQSKPEPEPEPETENIVGNIINTVTEMVTGPVPSDEEVGEEAEEVAEEVEAEEVEEDEMIQPQAPPLIDPTTSNSSLVNQDFESRLLHLRNKMADCVKVNDFRGVELIACEIVQLNQANN